MKKLNEVIVEKFGPIEKSIVPLAIKKGKSILVSGYNYVDLEKILIATKNLDINIYTHINNHTDRYHAVTTVKAGLQTCFNDTDYSTHYL